MSADNAIFYREIDGEWYVMAGLFDPASEQRTDAEYRRNGRTSLGLADCLIWANTIGGGLIHDPSPRAAIRAAQGSRPSDPGRCDGLYPAGLPVRPEASLAHPPRPLPPPQGTTRMNHSPEPWLKGCWEREQRGRKLYYVFREKPTDVFGEVQVYSGVQYGDEVHRSDWDRGRAPAHVVIGLSGDCSDTHLEFEDVDLDRAIACVNALTGIENPQEWTEQALNVMENIVDGLLVAAYREGKDSKRIAACLHACKDVPTDVLETLGNGPTIVRWARDQSHPSNRTRP